MDKKLKVILLSGKSESGKDYFAGLMKQQLEEDNKKVLITHYADLLKYILRTFFDWNGQKDEHGRYLLQHVGTDIIRKQSPDFWVNFLNNLLTLLKDEWDYVLIPDARFPNEIEVIKNNSNFEVITVRIYRPNYVSKLTEEQKQHSSETALDNYKFNYYLFNNGIAKTALYTVKTFLRKIKEKPKTIMIDLDGVTINTVKVITELYDEDFCYYSDYKKIPWEQVRTWNFLELKAATPEYINTYFNQKRFFDKVEMFPHAKEVIDKLSDKYNITFVSHGFSPNLRLKEEWVKEHFPYADFIGVNLKFHKDKSNVDMSNCIFIDDNSNNLKTSNASMKICFGELYDWNDNFIVDKINNFVAIDWNDVKDLLL